MSTLAAWVRVRSLLALVTGFAAAAWTVPHDVRAVARDLSTDRTVPLRGTFLQLGLDQRWTEPRLRVLFGDVRRLEISEIVVQWAVFGTKAFYPSKAFESISDPPLETVLALADEFGLKVRVGLAHDPDFWDQIKADAQPGEVEAYLQHLHTRSETVARELVPLVSRHVSFEGWFITEEVDDVNWVLPARRRLIRSYLNHLGAALHALVPSKDVAISGFSNAYCDPSALEAFWTELLDANEIDRLLFQDGIGAHKLELLYLALYLEAVKRAVVGTGHALSVVVELFDQVAGPPINEAPFRAVPTDVERLARQLSLAGAASTAGTLAFSVPDYMSPGSGLPAGRLFNDYLNRVCGDACTTPSPKIHEPGAKR
jgi:hypothetical protein